MPFNKPFILLLILLLAIACEKETDWEIENSVSHLVVDAIITNEYQSQKIFVSQSGTLNTPSQPISKAYIQISDGDRLYIFNEKEDEKGTYISEPFNGKINTNYQLVVQYESLTDTAYASMFPISEIKRLNIIEKDTLYYTTYTGSNLPAMTEVIFDWSANKAYSDFLGTTKAKQTHYTLHNFDITEEFGPEKQRIFFPQGTQIIQNKYSLSTEHQNFIRSLLIETEWRGGLLDVEQANVPTNFQNGILGWFGVCMALRDTMVVR